MKKIKPILMPCLLAVLVFFTEQVVAQSPRRTYGANNYSNYSSRRITPALHTSTYASNSSSFTLSDRNPGGNPDVPVDGGISLLLAAGAAYGAKKARDAKRKQKTTNILEK